MLSEKNNVKYRFLWLTGFYFCFCFFFFFVYSFSQIVKDYHLLCEAVIEDIIVSLGSSKRNEKNPKFFNWL